MEESKKIYLARIQLKIFQGKDPKKRKPLLNRVLYEVYKEGNDKDGTLQSRCERDLDLPDSQTFEIAKIEIIREVGYENGINTEINKVKLDEKEEEYGRKDWFKNM